VTGVEQLDQAKELVDFINNLGSKNVILGGDFNCIPWFAAIQHLCNKGNMKDLWLNHKPWYHLWVSHAGIKKQIGFRIKLLKIVYKKLSFFSCSSFGFRFTTLFLFNMLGLSSNHRVSKSNEILGRQFSS
jgi:hypothetical protein